MIELNPFGSVFQKRRLQEQRAQTDPGGALSAGNWT